MSKYRGYEKYNAIFSGFLIRLRPFIMHNSLKSMYGKSLYPHPTNTMTQIALSDLPETIQALLTQAIQTGEPLTIAQNDRPVAIISPIKQSKRAAFGSAKDSGKIIGDIIKPT